MRIWYKTLIVPAEGMPKSAELDETFSDHATTMGGYECEGYDSVEEYYTCHYYFSPRHVCYERFLRCHLPKQGRVLSLASGRAVNEMRLVNEGYDILCSDLEPVCPQQTEKLFPGYRFMRFDILRSPLPSAHFDAVLSLGYAYLLDDKNLELFFSRV